MRQCLDYNLLRIDGNSGLHISLSSRLALTISGRSWSREVTPRSAIPNANSSDNTIVQESISVPRVITEWAFNSLSMHRSTPRPP